MDEVFRKVRVGEAYSFRWVIREKRVLPFNEAREAVRAIFQHHREVDV